MSQSIDQHRLFAFLSAYCGRPGLLFPDSPYGLCGRKSTLKKKKMKRGTEGALELCDSRGDRPGLPVPDSPYGLCGRKATLNLNPQQSSGAV